MSAALDGNTHFSLLWLEPSNLFSSARFLLTLETIAKCVIDGEEKRPVAKMQHQLKVPDDDTVKGI